MQNLQDHSSAFSTSDHAKDLLELVDKTRTVSTQIAIIATSLRLALAALLQAASEIAASFTAVPIVLSTIGSPKCFDHCTFQAHRVIWALSRIAAGVTVASTIPLNLLSSKVAEKTCRRFRLIEREENSWSKKYSWIKYSSLSAYSSVAVLGLGAISLALPYVISTSSTTSIPSSTMSVTSSFPTLTTLGGMLAIFSITYGLSRSTTATARPTSTVCSFARSIAVYTAQYFSPVKAQTETQDEALQQIPTRGQPADLQKESVESKSRDTATKKISPFFVEKESDLPPEKNIGVQRLAEKECSVYFETAKNQALDPSQLVQAVKKHLVLQQNSTESEDIATEEHLYEMDRRLEEEILELDYEGRDLPTINAREVMEEEEEFFDTEKSEVVTFQKNHKISKEQAALFNSTLFGEATYPQPNSLKLEELAKKMGIDGARLNALCETYSGTLLSSRPVVKLFLESSEVAVPEIPEEALSCYLIKIDGRTIALGDNPRIWAECINRLFPSLTEQKRVRAVERTLQSLWRLGGISQARKHAIESLGKECKVDQLGAIEVDIKIERDYAIITHRYQNCITCKEKNYLTTSYIKTLIKLDSEKPPISIFKTSAPQLSDLEFSVKEMLETDSLDGEELKARKYLHSLKSVAKYLDREILELSINSEDLLELSKIAYDDLQNQNQKEIRLKYYTFLAKLRELLATNTYPPGHPIFSIVEARFSNEMYEYCAELITKALQLENTQQLAGLSLEDQFSQIQQIPYSMQASRLAVNMGKLAGSLNLFFDPHNMTNVPYKNFSHSVKGKKRVNLRFGTPTKEGTTGFLGNASVIEEFKAFLCNYSHIGKKHLYINLQHRNWRLVGNEQARSTALEKLSEEYPENFFIATFAQDTPFYKQSGRYESISNVEEFKHLFLDQMLEENEGGFFFSENLRTEYIKKILPQVLEEVHSIIFDNAESLPKEQRQAFIEIAYSFMTDRLLEISEADSYNMSCKDAIDRGGKCSAIKFYLSGMLNGLTKDPEFLEQFAVITHAPAMIVKKQAIITGRKKVLLYAMNALKSFEKRVEKDATALESLKKLYDTTAPKVYRAEERAFKDMLNEQVELYNSHPDNCAKAFPTITSGEGEKMPSTPFEIAEDFASKKLYEVGSEKKWEGEWTHGKFAYQLHRDLNLGEINYRGVERVEGEDYLAKCFLALLEKLTSAGYKVDKTTKKAVHIAMITTTQGFESHSYHLLHRLTAGTALAGKCRLASASKVEHELEVGEGNIFVHSWVDYPLLTYANNSIAATVQVKRRSVIPIKDYRNSYREPDIASII